MNNGRSEKSTQSYTLVTKKITQRARRNGVFSFIQDLAANDPLIQYYGITLIQRQDTETHTLLLHLKRPQVQTLLGYPCTEEHVSIEEWFLNQDHFLSAAHIKMVFGPYTARIYVDQKGKEIGLKVKFMDSGVERRLEDNDPTVLLIRENIDKHPNIEAFQTMLKNIFQAKSDKLSALYRKTMDDESTLTHNLAIANTYTSRQRKKLFYDIQEFIKDIETINRYDHDEQDQRGQYYQEILENQQSKHIKPTQPMVVIESKDDLISPALSPLDKVLPKNIAQESQEQIKTLVDIILETIHMEVLHEPRHVQFMHVYPLLIQLDIASLAAILNNKQDLSVFVLEQKSRLPFTVFSLDAYFSIMLLSGDIPAVEFLLPHLSNAQKYVHYWRFFQVLQQDPDKMSVENYDAMRFLYHEDERFKAIARLNLLQFQFFKTSQYQIFITVLLRLFIMNNLEGFRTLLAFEKERVMDKMHLIIDKKQYNLMNACILLYRHNPNPDFIHALFEYGMTIDHPVECFPDETLAQINTQMIKNSKDAFKKLVINVSAAGDKTSNNSLMVSMQELSLKHVELIELLIQHSDLESLSRAFSCFLSQEKFRLRLFVSHTPVIGAVANIEVCNDLMERLLPQPDFSKNIACVAYLAQVLPAEEAELCLNVVNLFGKRLSVLSDELSSEQKRVILHNLIQHARTAQKSGEGLSAFSNINAGLFVWTLIEDRNQSDYEAILQLLFLRGMVCTQIYSNNQDRLAYSCYVVGLDLIDDSENLMAHALKETPIYKLVDRSYQQCVARLRGLQEHSLFAADSRSQGGVFIPTQGNSNLDSSLDFMNTP